MWGEVAVPTLRNAAEWVAHGRMGRGDQESRKAGGVKEDRDCREWDGDVSESSLKSDALAAFRVIQHGRKALYKLGFDILIGYRTGVR